VKLTKREKIMLIVLGLIIIIGGYYKFILTPQLTKLDNMRQKVIEEKAEVKKVKLEISENSPVYKEFKIINAKIKSMTKPLFPIINQEKIIVILDGMIKASNIEGNSINFSDIDISKVDVKKQEAKDKDYLIKNLSEEYKGKKTAKKEELSNQNEEDSEENKNEIEKMTATISYKGKYKDLIKFLEQVEVYEKKILVNNISISKSKENSEDEEGIIADKNIITGSIALDFYAATKIHEQDEEYLKWDFDNGYGKGDPFVPFSGYSEYNKNNEVANNDFIMTVKPISSDLPTVILGRAMDKLGRSYIYADNKDFEDVELQIVQVDKKYYYKYKTQGESFPKDYENNMMEFDPHGTTVKLNIISNKRNSEEDTSGINLSLINKTNLKLSVNIDYEDDKNPRVKVVNKLGNVKVIK
jgi:type IV pilus assembly protein PilO